MNAYNIITITMLILAVVVVNTDDHPTVQKATAVMTYVLLILLMVLRFVL